MHMPDDLILTVRYGEFSIFENPKFYYESIPIRQIT